MRVRGALSGFLRSLYASTMLFGVLPFKQNPFWALSPALAPFAFLLFLSIYRFQQVVPFALIGGLISIVVANSISMESDAAFNRIVLRLDSMFALTKGGLIPYAIGLALGNLINAVPGVAVFAVLLWTMAGITSPQAWATMLGALTLIWAVISLLGYLISTYARDIRDLWVYSPLMTALLGYLPPVYYPLELLPDPLLRAIAFISPTTSAARLMHSAAGLVKLGPEEFAVLWAIPAVHAVVFAALLYRRVRRPI
ncbi:MAG: ABC transporter permease [Nitrososphaerota archaeon]